MAKDHYLWARTALAAMTLAGAVAGVAGCSQDDGGDPPRAEKTPSRSADPTVPAGDNGDIKDAQGARGDLADFTCERSGDSWTAQGVVQNPSAKKTTYLVTVSVFSRKSGAVVGLKEEQMTIKGNEKRELLYESLYEGSEKGLECAARVVKGS